MKTAKLLVPVHCYGAVIIGVMNEMQAWLYLWSKQAVFKMGEEEADSPNESGELSG